MEELIYIKLEITMTRKSGTHLYYWATGSRNV